MFWLPCVKSSYIDLEKGTQPIGKRLTTGQYQISLQGSVSSCITKNACDAELNAGYPADGGHVCVEGERHVSVEHAEPGEADAAADVEEHDGKHDEPVGQRLGAFVRVAARKQLPELSTALAAASTVLRD